MVFSMVFHPKLSSTPICGSESTLGLPLGLYWTNSFSWNNSTCLGRLQCFTSWCLISDDFSCHLSFSLSCCCLSGSCPSCHSPMLPGPPLSLTRVSKIYLINSQWPLRRFRYDCNLPDCLLIASSYTISTDLVFQLIIWIAPSRWVCTLGWAISRRGNRLRVQMFIWITLFPSRNQTATLCLSTRGSVGRECYLMSFFDFKRSSMILGPANGLHVQVSCETPHIFHHIPELAQIIQVNGSPHLLWFRIRSFLWGDPRAFVKWPVAKLSTPSRVRFSFHSIAKFGQSNVFTKR